jgi:hypothetical protein
LRVLMSNARSEIALLESSGNVHALCTFLDSPQRRKERRGFAEKTIKGQPRSIRGDTNCAS